MHPKALKIEDYTYNLPEERIAKYPLESRDASRLLIYQDGVISEDNYRNIANHIPQGMTLVFNQTKVVHARLIFRKPTGSVIEVFCLEPDERYGNIQTAMLQKGKVWWKCLIGGAGKWKHGMVLQANAADGTYTLSAAIAHRQSDNFIIEFTWNNNALTFAEVLHHIGQVPLPPYLHREAEAQDESRYQTIFASEAGSVAAPTAGLHFTPAVLQSLETKQIRSAFVTLHVGAGTFKPVKSDTIGGHAMHAEWMGVDVGTINQLINALDNGIVAVGTTSLRTLESLYWIGAKLVNKQPVDFNAIAVSQWEPYDLGYATQAAEALAAVVAHLQQSGADRLVTRTQIIIAPGYKLKVATGLVTNFHQPQSTLLLLVAALIGDDWKRVYQYALTHGFRFLSYGDGCLLWQA